MGSKNPVKSARASLLLTKQLYSIATASEIFSRNPLSKRPKDTNVMVGGFIEGRYRFLVLSAVPKLADLFHMPAC
jgi:hypothetical protein